MIHSMTVRSNPRLILLGLLLLALPISGITFLCKIPGSVGVVGLLASGFITYQLAKYMIPVVRVRIETHDDGITCTRPGSKTIILHWTEITVAGLVRQKSEKPSIFVYHEADDQLLLIPQEFSNFDQLLARVQQQTPFQNVYLDDGDSIKDWLRQHLNIMPDAADKAENNDHSAENGVSETDSA